MTLNTVEFINSLLLSGEMTYLEYITRMTTALIVLPKTECIDADGLNYIFSPGTHFDVNGAIIEFRANGLLVNGVFVGALQKFEINPSTGNVTISGTENCFLAGTPILLSDGSEEAIETIRPGDLILSYTADGGLISARVTATSVKRVKIVLDLFGLMMTPGHVTLCGDGPFKGRHVPLIDILRSDGALVAADGTPIRAATGALVDSEADRMVWAVTGNAGPDGFLANEARQIRTGTRVLLPDGRDFALLDIIAANGGRVTEKGLIAREGVEAAPFVWTFSPALPRPEDHVLARSAVTLSDIHAAAEWEDVEPFLPAPPPAGLSDLGPALPPRPGLAASISANRPAALRAEDAGAVRGPRRLIVQG